MTPRNNNYFNRNETIEKPAPAVRRALRAFDISTASRYFDGYYGSTLAPAVARKYSLPESRVSVGYGAEFFLRSLFDACSPKRDVILANAPHYGFYDVYAKVRGVRLATFDLADRGDRFESNIEDCIKKINLLRPKIVLITSPNSPTGNSISPKDLDRVLRAMKRLPKKDTLVVLDEAYWGFNKNYDEGAFLSLLRRYDNLVILRSFSKYYALAGLRLGFALWGKRVKQIARFDGLYLGGSQLLEEIALAAFQSQPYYQKLAKKLIARRTSFIASVNHLKFFKAYTSDANFVFVKILLKPSEKKALEKVEKELRKLPIPVSKFVTPFSLRVSLGHAAGVADFLLAAKKIDKQLGATTAL